MVNALLAGTKTQTRRGVKFARGAAPCRCNHPSWACKDGWYCRTCGGGVRLTRKDVANTICPYGVPGERLIVRETFRLPAEYDHLKPKLVRQDAPVWYDADGRAPEGWGKTRVSIHMPRWASRLTLEITQVRIERLQAISAGDADAECFGGNFPEDVLPDLFPRRDDGWGHLSMPECYARLWESINGPGSWAANPWVWAVTFRPVRGNIDALRPL